MDYLKTEPNKNNNFLLYNTFLTPIFVKKNLKLSKLANTKNGQFPRINSYHPSPDINMKKSPKYEIRSKVFDSNNLVKRLSTNKMSINKTNNELIELKSKYYKLLEENKNIKNIIAKVLKVHPNAELTNEEMHDRIKYCKLSKEERIELQNAIKIIDLKISINDKNTKMNEYNQEIDYFTKSTKSKIINELEKEYFFKNEKKRQLEQLIKDLKNVVDNNLKKLEELKNKYNDEKEINTKIKNENFDLEKKLLKSEEDIDELNSNILEIRKRQEKIQSKIKYHKFKNEKVEELMNKVNELEEIEKYMEIREEVLKEIQERKNHNKTLEKQFEEQNRTLEDAIKKNKKLIYDMDNYNKECSKLIKKSYQSLNIKTTMQDLEDQLTAIRKEYKIVCSYCLEKKNKLKILTEKSKLYDKINDVKEKIDNININIKESEGRLAMKKKINEDRQKELDSLREKVEKYKKENKSIKSENKKMKEEIKNMKKEIDKKDDKVKKDSNEKSNGEHSKEEQ